MGSLALALQWRVLAYAHMQFILQHNAFFGVCAADASSASDFARVWRLRLRASAFYSLLFNSLCSSRLVPSPPPLLASPRCQRPQLCVSPARTLERVVWP